MVHKNTTWLTLTVAICFAILQAFQPFIHAHLDTEHPIQHTGFHVGDELEESVVLSGHTTDHALSNVPHVSHTISVESGIKKDLDLSVLIDVVGLVLFFICLVIIAKSLSVKYFSLDLNLYSPLKRRLPASRAPPQF